MWWQTKIEIRTMPIELDVDSKHEWSSNTIILFCSKYMMISYWTLANKWCHPSKTFTMVKNVLSWISYLILVWKKWKYKLIGWITSFSIICESTALDAKLKTFISKINGLKRSSWINMGQLWKNIQRLSDFSFNSLSKRLIHLK